MKSHTVPLSVILMLLALAGCSTSQQTLLPVDKETTMLSLWARQGGSTAALYDQRSELRRPLVEITVQAQQPYTRTAADEIKARFKRLPNPDMVMYVYPHLTAGEPTPVPGYSTVFPLYTRMNYALPGERTEAL
ncbi:TIGR03751 family conjugal transfer lipoprotein [Erwinia psidii]|uniref:TIGR03751 family conjugal transfer lipoprotein n=1 Tax=Erwinia psidii TaxID=69224 RepID=UPI00226BA519|nr:TIGR03751 family conjugal transfer lipoprotein [Erwinia psidii]MCX8967295.1 TIGR03751 family conjugal transfer lipoprotein [Erwinia psidii]